MTDKLSLYNNTLIILESRTLATLGEDRKSRRTLDTIFDQNFVRGCLEDGLWNFGTRDVKITATPSVTPAFGYDYAFEKPVDWVRTTEVAQTPGFGEPQLTFDDKGAYLFGNYQSMFWRYVSSDTRYGGDMSHWPQSFVDYFCLKMASKACLTITGSQNKKLMIDNDLKKAKAITKSVDAQNGPSVTRPVGSWVRSRVSGWGSRSRNPGRVW